MSPHEKILQSATIGDVELKLVVFSGVGYEIHERHKGWGWGILLSCRDNLPHVEAEYEKAKREHAITQAEEALGLDELVTCPGCYAIEGTPEWGTVGDGYDGYCPSCADEIYRDDEDEEDE